MIGSMIKYDFEKFKNDFAPSQSFPFLLDLLKKGPLSEEEALEKVLEMRTVSQQKKQSKKELLSSPSQGYPSKVKRQVFGYLKKIGAIIEKEGLLYLNEDFIPKNQNCG